MTTSQPRVKRIGDDRLAEVVAVHCDAFAEYPTLRFVLGDTEPFDKRLEALIGLFIDNTALRRGVVLGIEDDEGVAAAADVVASDAPQPVELIQRREALWQRLGQAARNRYDAYSAVTARFVPAVPHYYLSMLGVRRRAAGRGLARPLLEAVHELSAADPRSRGVALETEDRRNLTFYEHFGYSLTGHGRVTEELESWGFFRPDD